MLGETVEGELIRPRGEGRAQEMSPRELQGIPREELPGSRVFERGGEAERLPGQYDCRRRRRNGGGSCREPRYFIRQGILSSSRTIPKGSRSDSPRGESDPAHFGRAGDGHSLSNADRGGTHYGRKDRAERGTLGFPRDAHLGSLTNPVEDSTLK